MKILLILFVIALSSSNSQAVFKNCGHDWDKGSVIQIDVAPNPPVKSQVLMINITHLMPATGYFIEAGDSELTVQLAGTTVHKEMVDLCQHLIDSKCPLTPGVPFISTYNYTVPETAPSGKYSITILTSASLIGDVDCAEIDYSL
eukprot:TRINITY_DN9656_c0_g4_i5.p1 TRINITY_DN9656_c0_g4~~TRINITY_DN9656_c0_g4_i5.p1  ORF type:complete len:145 (-),score=23.50 TRINITY_DN9656_c0_g4_i5:268-702(-)